MELRGGALDYRAKGVIGSFFLEVFYWDVCRRGERDGHMILVILVPFEQLLAHSIRSRVDDETSVNIFDLLSTGF